MTRQRRPQAAAGQQSAAWAEAERSLQDRLRHAETAAASASGQAARLGLELEQGKQQLAGATEQLAEARAALSEAQQALDVERQRRATAETTAGHLRSDLASAQESLNTLEKVGQARTAAADIIGDIVAVVWITHTAADRIGILLRLLVYHV